MNAPTPKKPSERGGRYAKTEFGPEHRAAARAIFESKPGMTCNEIAREMGVHEGTLRRWKSDAAKAGHPWRAAKHMPKDLGARAGALAATFKAKVADLGPLSPEQENVTAMEVSELHAIELRAQIIKRHQVEWNLPRRLVYEAGREGNLDKARLALVAAQTIHIIQTQERRAHFIPAEAFGPEPVVIEVVRETARQPPSPDEVADD